MPIVYATLVVKKEKAFDEVHDSLKEQVKKILIDLGRFDLLVE